MALTPTEWYKELDRLSDFYHAWEIPTGKVRLPGITINRPKEFVEICFSGIRDREPSVWKEGNFCRLQALETYMLAQEKNRNLDA